MSEEHIIIANKIRTREGREPISVYKNNLLTGWGYCRICRKDTNQITIFDNEVDKNMGLCTKCFETSDL